MKRCILRLKWICISLLFNTIMYHRYSAASGWKLRQPFFVKLLDLTSSQNKCAYDHS